MTVIPVIWVSYREDIMCRGYHDQGFLEAIFDRTHWIPQHSFSFSHYEIHRDSGPWPMFNEGAVVVLPARHHVDYVERFKKDLDKLPWSLVILAGDEEWVFPWREIEETPTRRVWVMQPRPEHREAGRGLLPGGWYPGTRQHLYQGFRSAEHTPRVHSWFFAGQVTHERRVAAAHAMAGLSHLGMYYPTGGYTQGMPPELYFDYMAHSKVVISPSGPYTPDTARTFEALEAGCVPFADSAAPNTGKWDYWSTLFGDDHPIPIIDEWEDGGLERGVNTAITYFNSDSNRVFAFWQQWKRDITLQMDNTIRSLRKDDMEIGRINDVLTVLVTTSPSPLHPATEHLEITIESIRDQLPSAEIVLVFDGVRSELEHEREAYEEYTRRALWLCNWEWVNVVPVVLESWHHQANATRVALDFVNTPFVMFCEHDTPIKGDIPWENLINLILSGQASHVRLHQEDHLHDEHRPMLLEQDGDFVKTIAWWQRPHVCRTDFYRERVMGSIGHESRTMIEEVMYGIVANNPWDDWKCWIYAPTGDPNIQRSYHLDSRGEDPKFDMLYRYDGETPEGAPRE
jgi:hypothetical protein